MKIAKGFTLVEIMLVVALIALLAGLAVPQVLRSRLLAHEAAAIAGMKAIHKGCLMYYSANDSSYPLNGLTDLASASPAYIDSVLGSGTKQGYQFTFTFVDADHYFVNADPVTPGVSGNRYFYIDQEGAIHSSTTGQATAADPLVQ